MKPMVKSALVAKAIVVWRGVGEPPPAIVRDARADEGWRRWHPPRELIALKEEPDTRLILEDGTRVLLPFSQPAWVLPDRTGVLVIFPRHSYVRGDGDDIFRCPNNAAIFNADGSLRFQLQVGDDHVDHIERLYRGDMPMAFRGMLGVLVQDAPTNRMGRLFAVDPDQPRLICSAERTQA